MELRIAQSALADLQAIRDHYSEQDVPAVGREFIEAILAHAQMLTDHPDAGRKVPEFDQDHIRELIHPPYRVVYVRQSASVTLIRVWRSERLLELPDDATTR